MRIRLSFLLFLLVICLTHSFSQNSEFSPENARAILKTLVVDIGPRPMGSPAEQRALDFAVDKFNEYGCDTSYVLPMTVAEGVNTKSGVAVGVKKGKTNRIIVIGGHIDSSGPEVLGANDDGSGVACVIELARVLCQGNNESTVYFCCWGGEEQGLRGSTHFVSTFPDLDSVVLMLQLDMADGSSFLIADPDGSKESAPSWLVKSAFDIFNNELNMSGLVYQSEASTLSLAAGGAFGSDHIPFLDKGIPAIDFTSDVTFPIHTPQDSWENFTPGGLKRSGDLVLKLFEKYDGGVPSRSTERYQLLQFGSNIFLLSYPLLWVFIAVSLGVGILAYVQLWKKRHPPDPATRVKWSRLKLLIAAIVIQMLLWSSETLVGFLKGYRFPWVNNQAWFLILGILFGLIGLWLVLQTVRRYPLSGDAFVFGLLSFFPFFVLTILASSVTPELGMYPAASLLLFSLAVVVRRPGIKVALFALAFVVTYNLLFFDGIGLLQRAIAQNQIASFWQKSLFHLGYIVTFTLLSLPFVHGFAVIFRSADVDLLWLKGFKQKSGLVVTSVATVGVIGFLLAQPVYGDLWYNNVRVDHRYTIGADTSSLTVKGSEYFRGLAVTINGHDTSFTDGSNQVSIAEARDLPVTWVERARGHSMPARISDSTWEMQRTLTIRSQFRPLYVNVLYESDQPFDVSSHWMHGGRNVGSKWRESDRRKVFRWYSFPDTVLTIPVSFTLCDSQRVSEHMEVVFDSVGFPIRLSREFTNIMYRTTVTAADTFSVEQE